MRRTGLRKWDTMVKAAGEVVEENNKMLLENLAGNSKREASKL